MSKYRHWWRPSVERDVRAYPALKQKKNELQKISITPAYGGQTARGPDVSRTTEAAAMRQLPEREGAVVDAVERAMQEVARQKDGKEVLAIVEMVDFKRTHTIEGVAMKLSMDRRTVLRRRNRFLYIVAEKEGYL